MANVLANRDLVENLLADGQFESEIPWIMMDTLHSNIKPTSRQILAYLRALWVVPTSIVGGDVALQEAPSRQSFCGISNEDLEKILLRLDQAAPDISDLKRDTACQYLFKLLDGVPELHGWKPVALLGVGATGAVIGFENAEGKRRTIKVFTKSDVDDFNEECRMQAEFARIGLALPSKCSTYRKWHCMSESVEGKANECTLFILETVAIDMTLADWMARTHSRGELDGMLKILLDFIAKMSAANLTHGDFHWSNIGIKNNKLMALDFAHATTLFADPFVDLIQLIRTSYPRFTGATGMVAGNYDYIRNRLIEVVRQQFPEYMKGISNEEQALIDLGNKVYRNFVIRTHPWCQQQVGGGASYLEQKTVDLSKCQLPEHKMYTPMSVSATIATKKKSIPHSVPMSITPTIKIKRT